MKNKIPLRTKITLTIAGLLSLAATLYAANPTPFATVEEQVAIAPSQSVNAGFTPRDIFVTQGPTVYKVMGGTVRLFTLLPACGEDETGITNS